MRHIYLLIIIVFGCCLLSTNLLAAPTINNLDLDHLFYTENQIQSITPALVDVGSDVTVSGGTWNGGSLRIEFTTGTTNSEDALYFGNYGTAAGQMQTGWIDPGGGYGNYVTYGGLLIGTWSANGGNSGNPIIITFNANATNANIQAIVRLLRYSNGNQYTPSEAQRNVKFTFTDNTGAAIVNTLIDVTAVDDAPKFLGAGYAATPFDFANGYLGTGYALAQQSDGKYVVVYEVADGVNWTSQIAVGRYTHDGKLDPTFGTNGIYYTGLAVASSQTSVKSVLIRNDGVNAGKIIVGFTENLSGDDLITLLQLTTSGTLDNTFGSVGKCSYTRGASGNLEELCVMKQQSDGKIVVAGSMYNISSSNRDITIWRFKSDGSGLDLTFNTTGFITTNLFSTYSYGYDLAIQSDGKILLGCLVKAASYSTNNTWDWAVRRYTTTGALDGTFGTAGMVQLDNISTHDQAIRIGLQTQGGNAGKIIVGGNYFINSTEWDNLSLVRLTSAGALDGTFGTAGRLNIDIANNLDDYPNRMIIDSIDNIFMIGSFSSTAGIVKVTPDGSLDVGFNGNGKLLMPELGESPAFYDLIIDSLGKLVITGSISDAVVNPLTSSSNGYALLLRLNPDGSYDSMGSLSFTEGGSPILLDDDMLVYDGELSLSNYAGSTLTVQRQGGANVNDIFSAKSGGSLGVLTQGANLLIGATNLGTITTNSNGTLVLSFNSTVNDSYAKLVINQLAYSNSSTTPPAYTDLVMIFNDGNSGVQGTGGAKSVSTNLRINLIDVPNGPDDPTGFSASVFSTSEIDLGWTLNGASDDVVLAYNTANSFSTPTGSYTAEDPLGANGTVAYVGGLTSYNHLSLNPNTLYYYKLFSYDGSAYSSGVTASEYTLANDPSDPTVNGATATTLNVAINANSNPAGTTYAIHETTTNSYVQADGTLGAIAWQTKSAWEVDAGFTAKTVTGLSKNTNYTFEVKARNGDLTPTGYSGTTSAYTLAAVPSAPTVNNPSLNTLDVIVNVNGNPAGTEFAVQETGGSYVQADGSLDAGEVWQDAATWGTITVTGLSVNVNYTFQVKARNADLTPTAFGVTAAKYTLANDPSAPTVNGATATTLDVAINANSNPAGTEFAIQETGGSGRYVQTNGTLGVDGGAAVWQTEAAWEVNAGSTAKTVMGLTPNTNYTFKVKARNGNLTGTGFSGTTSLRTLAAVPSAPTVNNPGLSTVDLIVNVNGNPAGTEFAIQETGGNYVQADGSLDVGAVWQDAATWATITVTGLSVNVNYTFQVKARDADLTPTAFGATASKYTLANVPSAPTVNAPTVSTLNVAINGNSNPVGTTFAIHETTTNSYVQADGTLGAIAWQNAATWGTKTVTGLTANTNYTFEVKARNGELTPTAFSGTSSLSTLCAEPGDDATAANYSNQTTTAFDITWTDGSADAYLIKIATGDYANIVDPIDGVAESDGLLVKNISSGEEIITFSGLASGTTYYIQIYPYNCSGATVNYKTSSPAQVICSTLVAYPTTQASNLYFSGVSRTGMTLGWTNGNGTKRLAMAKLSAISATPLVDGQTYLANSIYGSGDPIDGGYCIYNGVGSSVPVTGLTKYKLYYFRVFEFKEQTPGATLYLQTTNATNPSSRWTLRKDGDDPAVNPNKAFSIYPNPTVDLINYDFELSESVNVTTEVYTSDGRMVKSVNHGLLLAGEQKLSIGVNDLPNGVYMLQIRMGEELMLGIVEIVK